MSDTKPMYANAQVIPESIHCPGSSVIGLRELRFALLRSLTNLLSSNLAAPALDEELDTATITTVTTPTGMVTISARAIPCEWALATNAGPASCI